MADPIRCRYCEQRHMPKLLCDAAKKVLDALYARGMSFNMPTVEFPEPIPGAEVRLGANPGDKLLTQVVVKAGVIPVAGVIRPVVVFTGRTPYGEVLPQWIYAGDDEDMARLCALVKDVTSMAVRRAAMAAGG